MTKNTKTVSNLIPMNKRSKTEVRKIASRGGVKSGESRREKKAIRELTEMIGRTQVKSAELKSKMKELGVPASDVNYRTALIAVLYREGLQGDTHAIKTLLEIMGDLVKESPKTTLNFNMYNDVIGGEFVKDIKEGEVEE